MSWKRIPYRTLGKKLYERRQIRALATWHTGEGLMFAHGVFCSGPSKVEDREVVYFYMTYDGRGDSPNEWDYLPHPSYGFKPSGVDKYLSAQDLGLGANALRGGNGMVYFEAPSARSNQLRFYVPSDEVAQEEQPTDDLLMRQCMIEYGWRPREEWAKRITDELWRKRHFSGRYNVLAGDIVDDDELDEVGKIIQERLVEMERTLNRDDETIFRHRTKLWEMWGLASHIHGLPYLDFAGLLRDFHEAVYSVMARPNGISVSDMPFGEDRARLEAVKAEAEQAYRVAERVHFERSVASSVDDDAWAKEMRMRGFLADGGTMYAWEQKRMEEQS